MILRLPFYRLRFYFTAQQPVSFPPGETANSLRGALGLLLRRLCCQPDCPSAALCPLAGHCFYERLFAPVARLPELRGFHTPPRPLVLRVRHLDGRTVRPGEGLWFDVHLFHCHPPAVHSLVQAFAALATEGLGPLRRRLVLTSFAVLDLHQNQTASFHPPLDFFSCPLPPPLTLDLPLSAPPQATSSQDLELAIHFLTPTELKAQGRLRPPEAPVVASRAVDRIAALTHFYAHPVWNWSDFISVRRTLLNSAERLQLVQADLRPVAVNRRSSRTGQSYRLQGFVGEVRYGGPALAIETLLPWLSAARFTGLGRHTVWGKGEIALLLPHSGHNL